MEDTSVLLPFAIAKKFSILLKGDTPPYTLYFSALPTLDIISEIQRKHGSIVFSETTDAALQKDIQQSYENASSGSLDSFQTDAEQNNELSNIAMDLHEPLELLNSDDDAPIIRLLNALFAQAILEQASDIHIEPYEGRVRVRFRINGMLKQVLEPNLQIAPLLVSRIKVMAKLDIAEKRLPQDGRIAIKLGGRAVDMRISTIPSGNGEKVVMRILDKQVGRLHLKELGMDANNHDLLVDLIKKPHGIILVTGPTGSGKTTTLYAALSLLNNLERNLMTVEDPIEYHIDGINQTQINAKVNMTFARGLRAILRQDPDVVMVGEIRDSETATTAVQASLTGHLVLSTLHTNSSISTITRLVDMGVEPFLLASSLNAILAQRLVRKLCDNCKSEHIANKAEQEKLGTDEKTIIYQVNGCDKCNYSGYSGRIGLYELLVIDEDIKTAINNSAKESDMRKIASNKMSTLQNQAIATVLSGKTSLDEAIRIVFT